MSACGIIAVGLKIETDEHNSAVELVVGHSSMIANRRSMKSIDDASEIDKSGRIDPVENSHHISIKCTRGETVGSVSSVRVTPHTTRDCD